MAKRKTTIYKRYQIVCGKRILSTVPRRNEKINQTFWYCRFRCDCGERFEWSFSAVTQAEHRNWIIRCGECAKIDRRERDRARKTPRSAESLRRPNGLLDLSRIKLTPDQQQRVDALIARHYEASCKARTPKEPTARIRAEAIEIVLAEDAARKRGSNVEDYFSGEGVRRPAFQRYDQYFNRDSTLA